MGKEDTAVLSNSMEPNPQADEEVWFELCCCLLESNGAYSGILLLSAQLVRGPGMNEVSLESSERESKPPEILPQSDTDDLSTADDVKLSRPEEENEVSCSPLLDIGCTCSNCVVRL